MSDAHIDAPLVDSRVIDGDTIDAAIGLRLPIRIEGIDTPELRVAGQLAAALVAQSHTRIWIQQARHNQQTIMARATALGQYGRLVGDLYLPATGETLSGYLLAAGVAVKSEDGRRHQWTDEELRRIERLAP